MLEKDDLKTKYAQEFKSKFTPGQLEIVNRFPKITYHMYAFGYTFSTFVKSKYVLITFLLLTSIILYNSIVSDFNFQNIFYVLGGTIFANLYEIISTYNYAYNDCKEMVSKF